MVSTLFCDRYFLPPTLLTSPPERRDDRNHFNTFGDSAPLKMLLEKFNFTTERVTKVVENVINCGEGDYQNQSPGKLSSLGQNESMSVNDRLGSVYKRQEINIVMDEFKCTPM